MIVLTKCVECFSFLIDLFLQYFNKVVYVFLLRVVLILRDKYPIWNFEDTCDLIIKTVPDLPHNRIVLKIKYYTCSFYVFHYSSWEVGFKFWIQIEQTGFPDWMFLLSSNLQRNSALMHKVSAQIPKAFNQHGITKIYLTHKFKN